jgi:hypothetical protein
VEQDPIQQEMLTDFTPDYQQFLHGCNHGCKRMYFLAAAAITIAEPVVVSATISATTPLSCGAGNAISNGNCSRRKCSVPIQFQQPRIYNK